MDLVGAGLGALVTLPLFLAVSVAIRLTSPGPAIFRQLRMGHGGRPFLCLKLRTMVQGAQDELHRNPELRALHSENGFKLPTRADPRVTRVGALLRRTHLDELPQLWNVLRGEMSLVGPRPIEPEQYDQWVAMNPDAPEVLSARPGIFGAWTAQGQNRVGDPERILVELDYVRRRSWVHDMGILLRHVPVLLQGQRE